MIAALPTGSQGRLFALVLLLFVLAVAYLAVAAPLLDFYDEREASAATRAALLTRLNAVAAELPALRSRLAKLRAATDDQKLTLDGASDAIASAALQGRIEPLAAAAGLTIGSTEILEPEAAAAAYRRIGLRLIVTGPYEGVVKLLAAIEQAAPPLVVDDLQIRGISDRRLGPTSVTGVDASLDIHGFRASDTAAAAAVAKP